VLLELIAHDLSRAAGVQGGGGNRGQPRVELDRGILLGADPELRARVLRRVARGLGVDLSAGGTRAGVEFMSEGRSGGHVDLGGGLQASREYDRVTVGPTREEEAVSPLVVPGCGSGRGRLRIGDREYSVRWRPARSEHPERGRIAVPVPRGHYPLRLREWRPGDRIRLAGGTRKLKKLFNDRRIPAGERSRVPILVDSAERVLWVAGVAVAAVERDVAYEDALLELELADA
jgi:tRNA(Ile)-lysidine synthetase-like protein